MNTIIRSPELMSRNDTALLVIDVQEKLISLIPGQHAIVWNIRRLLDAANLLGLPALATEQYPKGLGHTVPDVASRLSSIPEKLSFSCVECNALFASLRERGIYKLLLVGIEAHVCVQQTALDLIAAGFRVYLAVDAIGARSTLDRDIAFRRLEASGGTLTTTEAALFEWCEKAGTAEFKQISQLVRETPPSA